MTSSSIRNAIVGVAGVTFLSKFLGFLREMVIANKFGTSQLYDSYLIAVMLPALFAGIFSYASVYLLVPFLSGKIREKDESGSLAAVWPLLNGYFLLSLVVSAFVFFGAPFLMKLWASGYDASDFNDIVFFARVTSAIILLSTLEAFFRSILNVRGIFTYPASGYILFNLFSISAVVLFADSLSVGAVALGLVGGIALQTLYLALRLIGMNPLKGYRLSLSSPEARLFLGTALILTLIETVNRSYFLIDRYYAAQFGTGIISALNYCQVLVQLPDAVVGFAIGTVLFPLFSRASLKEDMAGFGRLYGKAITTAILIAIPLAGFVYVGAEEIIALVFQRGQFDARSVEITATVLRPYAPTIVALFIISTSIRASYSGGWAKLVLLIVLVALAIKYLGTMLIPLWIGYAGISAATSAAFLSMALLMALLVTRRTGGEKRKGQLLLFVRLLIAGPIATVAVMSLKQYWLSYRPDSVASSVLFLAALFCTVVIFFMLAVLLVGGLGELRELRSSLLPKHGAGVERK